jgi:hypothetical protein
MSHRVWGCTKTTSCPEAPCERGGRETPDEWASRRVWPAPVTNMLANDNKFAMNFAINSKVKGVWMYQRAPVGTLLK